MTTYDDKLKVRVPVKAGARLVGVSFVSRPTKPEGIRQRPETVWSQSLTWTTRTAIRPSRTSRSTGRSTSGRVGHAQPPPALRLPARRSKNDVKNAAATRASVRGRFWRRLARRAYRRPVTDAEVDTLAGFFKAGRSEGFDAGIQLALERSSPIRTSCSASSATRRQRAPGAPYRLSDLELASRLSFFLWSSIPDDELLDAGGERQAARTRPCSSSRCGACWPTRGSTRSWTTSPASGS